MALLSKDWHLKVRFTPVSANARRWKLCDPLPFYGSVGGRWIYDKVPVGFETDLASVPRPLWAILPPFGAYAGAAIVHDYMTTCGYYDAKTADRAFLQIMKDSGVGVIRRNIMFWAVRLVRGTFLNDVWMWVRLRLGRK